MRVVQIANSLSVEDGGPARNALELGTALNALEGLQSTLFWLRGRYEESILASDSALANELDMKEPKRLSVWPRKQRQAASLLYFLRELLAADVVIIHGYFLFWVPPVSALLKQFGIPYVITPHGSLTLRQQGISRRKKAVYETVAGRFVRKNLATFVTGSEIEVQEIKQKFPAIAVAVGGVGVRLPEISKVGDPLSVPTQLLSMSRIAEKKRIDISIRSVGILVERGHDVVLTIAGVGSDDLTQRLRKLGRELRIEDRLNFTGQVVGEAKSALFRASDIFLLPSDDENFGIGFAEAMAHGLPSVVSTNVASATNMPAEAGELLASPTPEAVAGAIERLMNADTHRRGQISSRRFAESDFSWSSVAASWVDILLSHRKN